MSRTNRPRAADVKLPKTWGSLVGHSDVVVLRSELRRRLRDVAEAARFESLARETDHILATRIARNDSKNMIEWALDVALLYRGILSLCEGE